MFGTAPERKRIKDGLSTAKVDSPAVFMILRYQRMRFSCERHATALISVKVYDL